MASTAKRDDEIEDMETKIAAKTEEKYSNLIRETLEDINGEDGRINGNGRQHGEYSQNIRIHSCCI